MRAARTGVVILNYGPPEHTLSCLDSLERSRDLDLDIVVVDNGPDDEDFALLRRQVAERAHVVATGDNLGYAAGNNVGIRHVLDRGCELAWIINPDTVVERDTLPRLRRHLDSVRDCGIVGPRLVSAGTPTRIWFDGGDVDPEFGRTSHRHLAMIESRAPGPVVDDVDYVTGASMLVRRSMIEQVGFIPEHYFLYYEEVDWCLRARAAGWRVMVDQRARMVHHKRSSGELPQPYYVYYMTRNSYLFAVERLGHEPERTLANLRENDLDPWRARVQELAPRWLDTFDDLVRRAVDDARAGVHGRNDDIARISPPSHVFEEANV